MLVCLILEVFQNVGLSAGPQEGSGRNSICIYIYTEIMVIIDRDILEES